MHSQHNVIPPYTSAAEFSSFDSLRCQANYTLTGEK